MNEGKRQIHPIHLPFLAFFFLLLLAQQEWTTMNGTERMENGDAVAAAGVAGGGCDGCAVVDDEGMRG
jgi:hypothetical protein